MAIQAVTRALGILKLFSVDQPQLGITEISRRTGLHKATVQGLVQTLVEEKFLEQEPRSHKYALSLKLYELGFTAIRDLEVNQKAAILVPNLANKTNCVVRLGVSSNGAVLITMDAYPKAEPLLFRHYAIRAPLYCSAAGKAILAFCEPEERDAYLARTDLIPYTSNTITAEPDLLKELEQTQRRGYSINHEEYLPARTAIGAPIFGRENRVLAAVILVGEASQILGAQTEDLSKKLILTAQEISGALGFCSQPLRRGVAVL
jgi:IclR family transcriptional regulator, KDG regulon repressor